MLNVYDCLQNKIEQRIIKKLFKMQLRNCFVLRYLMWNFDEKYESVSIYLFSYMRDWPLYKEIAMNLYMSQYDKQSNNKNVIFVSFA